MLVIICPKLKLNLSETFALILMMLLTVILLRVLLNVALTFGGAASMVTVKLLLLNAVLPAKSLHSTSQTNVVSFTVTLLKVFWLPLVAFNIIDMFERQAPLIFVYRVQFARFVSVGVIEGANNAGLMELLGGVSSLTEGLIVSMVKFTVEFAIWSLPSVKLTFRA